MDFLKYVFPQNIKCIFCGAEAYSVGICDECRINLPIIDSKVCKCCGGRAIGETDVCVDCKSNDFVFNQCFCVLDYVDEVQEKILKFKNKKFKHIGKVFAHLMLDKFKTIDITFDEIIPVPIHPNRRKERGFNQSEILCEKIKKFYGRVHPEILERVLDTPHQAGLDRINRKENLDNAFKVKDKTRTKGKTILLVDDIYTTGTTINECAKALFKGGADKVYALCLSRTPIIMENMVK